MIAVALRPYETTTGDRPEAGEWGESHLYSWAELYLRYATVDGGCSKS